MTCPLKRVQEHPVRGLVTVRRPPPVLPVGGFKKEKKRSLVESKFCIRWTVFGAELALFIPFIPVTKSVTFPHGTLMPSLLWVVCFRFCASLNRHKQEVQNTRYEQQTQTPTTTYCLINCVYGHCRGRDPQPSCLLLTAIDLLAQKKTYLKKNIFILRGNISLALDWKMMTSLGQPDLGQKANNKLYHGLGFFRMK